MIRFAFLYFFLWVGGGNHFAQTCGGSFGPPVFEEDFGAVTNQSQTISPALNPPAFTTYRYVSIYPPNDGDYTISNQTSHEGWGWPASGDHTIDAPGKFGNMLVVNSLGATSGRVDEFYRRKVYGLCPGQVYLFSIWVLNIHRTNAEMVKPNITMQIRSETGELLSSINTGDVLSNEWQNYKRDFRADASSTTVEVVLINNALGGANNWGNDLAIDDITFSPCGPEASVTADVNEILGPGLCDNSLPLTFSASISPGTYSAPHFIWQKSSDAGENWGNLTIPSTNPNLAIASGSYQNGELYRFIVGEGNNVLSPSCQVISPPLKINVNGYPAEPEVGPFSLCQNSGDVVLSANNQNINWYNTAGGGVPLSGPPTIDTRTSGTRHFWVSQTINGCESGRKEIFVNVYSPPSPPEVKDVELCQNADAANLTADGEALTWYTTKEAAVGSLEAPIPDTSNAGVVSFWVSQKINGCESNKAEIKVTVKPAPYSVQLKNASICDGEHIELNVGEGFSSAVWQTDPPVQSSKLKVSEAGIYEVMLTGLNGCQAAQKVEVSAGDVPVITEILATENSLTINAEGGNPPYYYSIDGVHWQENKLFKDVLAGIYTVYVKSKTNSCTAAAQTAVVFIPNVITPNGDGKNDRFVIHYLEVYPEARLDIFNRFGKLVFSSKKSEAKVWDGTENGRNVASGTYWYHLDLGNGYQKSGWLLVKNQ